MGSSYASTPSKADGQKRMGVKRNTRIIVLQRNKQNVHIIHCFDCSKTVGRCAKTVGRCATRIKNGGEMFKEDETRKNTISHQGATERPRTLSILFRGATVARPVRIAQ